MPRAIFGRLVVALVGALGIAPGMASGASWTVLPSPNRLVAQGVLSGVSCAVPSSCLAVGHSANDRGISVTLAESWNGTSWVSQPVPAGGSSSVLSGISCPGAAACAAVGSHRNGAGTQVTLALARAGSSWAVQPTPNPAGASASALSSVSCTSAGACTAVGISTNSGGVTVALAERWNGTRWSIETVPEPSGALGSVLSAVSCPAPTSCTAVGSYTNSGEATLSLAEHWNGTSWAPQSTADPTDAGGDDLSGVSCTASTACTAVGEADGSNGQLVLAERWNGTSWVIQPTPDPAGAQGSQLLAVSCSSATACTAVGSDRDSGFTGHTLAERWNGTAWTLQTTPDPAGAPRVLAAVACASTSACTAAGSFGEAITSTLAEHWNGASWAIQPTPNPTGEFNNLLSGISCSASTACTAVGQYTTSASATQTLAERWDGASWALQSTATPAGAIGSQLLGVSCPAAAACSAVGFWQRSDRTSPALVEQWNGTRWAIEPTPAASGESTRVLTAVSCSAPAACTAVGYQFGSGDPVAPLAERWNGTSWTVQPISGPPGGTHSTLSAVSCSGPDACTAVGAYDKFSTVSATLAERWDGTAWAVQSTPNPANGTQPALSGVSCPAPAACTAVGYDYDASAALVALALGWNGATWTIQPVPTPSGSANDELLGVSCTAASSCTSVGSGSDSAGTGGTLAVGLTGTSWTVQPTPNPAGAHGSSLAGISCTSAAVCVASGGYAGDGTTATLAERYG
jgi:hypothetical protein